MKDFQAALKQLYDETLSKDFSCLDELFHPEYRSSTEEGEDSAEAFIAGTLALLEQFEILESEVLFTLGDASYVGIVHRFKVKTRNADESPIDTVRADFYRIQDNKFIEHWGVPAG